MCSGIDGLSAGYCMIVFILEGICFFWYLIEELIRKGDRKGIQEIADNLWNQDKDVANDCIKVLYEIGYRRPKLITGYAEDFVRLLRGKNNRLVWGAALALSTIAGIGADQLFGHIGVIKDAVKKGSVITQDNGIATLAVIASKNERYRKTIFPLLLEHLQTCRPKEIPQHSEKCLIAVTAKNKSAFVDVLSKRLSPLTSPQWKRVSKVIKQAEAL